MEQEKTGVDDTIPKRFPKNDVKEMAEYILKDIFQDFKLDYSKSEEMIQYSSKALSFVLKENFPKYDFFHSSYSFRKNWSSIINSFYVSLGPIYR